MKLAKPLRITIITTAILTTAIGTYAGVQAANGRPVVPQVQAPTPGEVRIVEPATPSETPTPAPAPASEPSSDESSPAPEQPVDPAESNAPAAATPSPTPTVQNYTYTVGNPVPTDAVPSRPPVNTPTQNDGLNYYYSAQIN